MDMWSIGVLTYLLLSGNQLAADKSDKDVRDIIKKGDFKIEGLDLVSEPGKDFIQKLLATDPEARISAADALAHPWLSSEFAATELPEAHTRLKAYRRTMQFRYMTYVYLTQHLL
jgi:serine/threonine protein kinase